MVLSRKPDAVAYIKGSSKYPTLRGKAEFYAVKGGVIVVSEAFGLPSAAPRPFGVFGYHIHEGANCAPNGGEHFGNTGGHYNPSRTPHPYHAGDLPPLFSNYGFAFGAVYTARFSLSDILGRTIIIHSGVDDFTTQPSGESGEKIACGVIERFKPMAK